MPTMQRPVSVISLKGAKPVTEQITSARTVVKIVPIINIIPPMVGVPCFLACQAGPISVKMF